MYECFGYMYVCVLCACLLPAKASRGQQITGTGVTNGDELCGHWKLNLGPPEEQSLNHEPSFQPSSLYSYAKGF